MDLGSFVSNLLHSINRKARLNSFYEGTSEYSSNSIGNGFYWGKLELPFSNEMWSRGVTDSTSIEFKYKRNLIGVGTLSYCSSFYKEIIAKFDNIMDSILEIGDKNTSVMAFDGKLELVKFKGNRKFYIKNVHIYVSNVY